MRTRSQFYPALCFLLPNFLGFAVFSAYPIGLSWYMSFTNWSLKPAIALEYVGWRNYADLLSDEKFWFYLYNTIYLLAGIPLATLGGLALAALLASFLRRRNFFANQFAGTCRAFLYLPSFTAGVATLVLWTQIFNPHDGLLNKILSACGIVDLPQWLVSTKNLLGFLPLPECFNNGGFGLGAREAILMMGVWTMIGGNSLLLYLAALLDVPRELYEAAEIDGASSWAKFRYLTIPSVAPTTFFILLMALIGGLQGGFDFAKVMTNGGPAETTTTLAYYLYTTGFEELQLGMASAIAWTIGALIFALSIIHWRYNNRECC